MSDHQGTARSRVGLQRRYILNENKQCTGADNGFLDRSCTTLLEVFANWAAPCPLKCTRPRREPAAGFYEYTGALAEGAEYGGPSWNLTVLEAAQWCAGNIVSPPQAQRAGPAPEQGVEAATGRATGGCYGFTTQANTTLLLCYPPQCEVRLNLNSPVT